MKVQLKILNKEFYCKWDKDPNGGQWCPNPNESNKLPSYATSGSAGLDLKCTKDVTIYPGEIVKIPTGLAVWLGATRDEWLGNDDNDFGVMGTIVPRSGLGTRGLILANTVGIIDEDYQGELTIAVWNRNDQVIHYNCRKSLKALKLKQYYEPNDGDTITLKAGDRIAQLIFQPFIKCEWDVVEEFSNETERGEDGFGSTGE